MVRQSSGAPPPPPPPPHLPGLEHTVNALKFLTLYSILLWPKFCFLSSWFLKDLKEWLTVQPLVRLLFHEGAVWSSSALFAYAILSTTLDQSISKSRVSSWFLLLLCFIEIPVINANSVDPDQMLHSAASDLGWHCLLVIVLGVSIIKWVNFNIAVILRIWKLKAPITIAAEDISKIFFLIFKENKSWYFIWIVCQIVCLADNSHEISRLVFFEKLKK